jgi:hypothetical protein
MTWVLQRGKKKGARTNGTPIAYGRLACGKHVKLAQWRDGKNKRGRLNIWALRSKFASSLSNTEQAFSHPLKL